jgi:hypothetical protein
VGTEDSTVKLALKTKEVGLGLSGNAKAWLEWERQVVPWGQPVVASLGLRGGDREHRITSAVVASLSHTHLRTDSPSVLVGTQVLAPDGFIVQPGETTSYPICLEVPKRIPLDCSLELSVVIRSGMWSQGLTVVMSTEVPLIQLAPSPKHAALATGFARAAAMMLRGWGNGGGEQLIATFEAEGPWSYFYRARLELTLGDEPCGQVVLTPTVAPDRWYSQYDFTVPIPQFDADPDRLCAAWQELLPWRVGAAGKLPVPSELTEVNDLPLPADGDGVDYRALPRPADPGDKRD